MISDIMWLKRMLSHNVRMPMSVINGYGELLRQGLLSPEEKEEAIQNICDNITYMDEALRVVLEEDEKAAVRLEAVDLPPLLHRITKYVSEVAKKIPLRITVKTQEPHMFIRAELIPIMRVFYQLFENAMKYLPPESHISVYTYYVEDEKVLIVFKDDGIGMDEKEVKLIFQEGFRGKNSMGKSGSGFGMYDVKRTVERYGGTVEVSSRRGMGFVVFLMFSVYREEENEGA